MNVQALIADCTPTSLRIMLEGSADLLDLDVVRTGLAEAATIAPSEITDLKVTADSFVILATVPRFAAEIVLQSFNMKPASLQSIAERPPWP
jgi:hypothetical protein